MLTTTRSRPIGWRLTASTLALGVALGATTADAVQRTWTPGGSPCGPLLQNCINFAAAGDTINIAFSGFIPEDVTVTKSLMLRAAGAHTPQFTDFPVVFLFNEVGDQNVIRLEGLEFDRARIVAIQTSLLPFVVSIRDIGMNDTVNGFTQVTVRVDQSGGPPADYGPIVALIENSRFTIPAASTFSGAEAISFESGTASSMTAIVRNNQIRHFDGQQLGAISIYNEASNVVADVIGNDIRGDNFNNGVQFRQVGPGTAHVRFLGNLVVGQVDDAGAPSAFGIDVTEGQATFEIVNNTAFRCDNGVRIGGSSQVASWSGVVANNIVATMDESGMIIQQPTPSQGVVENDHNLIYEVASNFFVPGPGTLFSNPQFVAGDQVHIDSDSPARNAGNNARVPNDLLYDLDGHARKIGTVDIGADESTITVSAPPDAPGSYALEPNVPNPFNPTTVIRYRLPGAEQVFLGVYDAGGGLVRWLLQGEARGPGRHSATWDGRDAHGVSMASGIYFYRLNAGPFSESRRMALVR